MGITLVQDSDMNNKEKTLAEKREAIIQAYQKKIDQIDAQLADLTAREKLAERKRDTRRKVIMGALAGYHMRKNPRSDFAKKLAALIDEYVIGDRERSLFDLDPLPKDEQDNRKRSQRIERKEIDGEN
jgi:hypothetical protein